MNVERFRTDGNELYRHPSPPHDGKKNSPPMAPTEENDLFDDDDRDEKGEIIEFNTKLERMVYKIRFLKMRAMQFNDRESLKHIDW